MGERAKLTSVSSAHPSEKCLRTNLRVADFS
jgi:hypothetical protein